MPELPEVETFARSLKAGGMTGSPILFRRIQSAGLFWERTLAFSDVEDDFLSWFSGKIFTDVTRRGKYLLLHIPPKTLMIHLRMSGDLHMRPAQEPPRAHDRFQIVFEDGERLAFNDTRKFGRIWLADDVSPFLARLGVEPFSDQFNVDWLGARLSERNRMIKPFLLDQLIIAGIGNIYTDEALFRARIHPARITSTLSRAEVGALWGAIRAVLEDGIRTNGASIDWVYRGGEFQNLFQVVQRKGLPCLICGALIEKTVIGQRGTCFCPRCQPAP